MKPAARRFATLEQWLAWQETLHVREIDLGLQRVREVAGRMGVLPLGCPVLTVAGTNGKGSTVAMLEAMLAAAGYRVGCYCSPHLVRYNERVRVAGQQVSDEALCAAFERVEAARGSVMLTYFEFGTLAALDVLGRSGLDAAVLEVGMGGRLDAVNLVDTDVAVIATIDIDHVEWLGPDRESIGREKAGIMRAGRPALCSDPAPPASLIEHASQVGADLRLIGRDYGYEAQAADGQPAGSWSWWSASQRLEGLPRPALVGEFQLQNAAGALMALELAASGPLRVPLPAMRQGLRAVHLPGRFQVLPGPVQTILDVAHNAESARILAANLRAQPVTGRTHAVIGMLKDKDPPTVVEPLAGLVDAWHAVSLGGPRGAPAARLGECVARLCDAPVREHDSVSAALEVVRPQTRPGDRVLVVGSFLTVADALRVMEHAAGG